MKAYFLAKTTISYMLFCMNILVDLRIPNSKTHELWWIEHWIETYLSTNLSDSVSWIGFERVEYSRYLLGLPHTLLPSEKGWISTIGKKRMLSKLSGDIVFSFSEEMEVPRHIPILYHPSSYARFLSPENNHPLPFDRERYYLVHTLSKKKELIERFSIDESHIIEIRDWVPSIIESSVNPKVLHQYSLSDKFLIHDGGLGRETELLKLIEYWHEKHPSFQLVILGALDGGYELYKEKIREYGLHDAVRILGALSEEHLHELYLRARGWIYIGYHFCQNISLSRAISYSLPLILSQIEDFRYIPALKVNHRTRKIEEDLSVMTVSNPSYGHGNSRNEHTAIELYHELFEKIGKNTRKA